MKMKIVIKKERFRDFATIILHTRYERRSFDYNLVLERSHQRTHEWYMFIKDRIETMKHNE